MPFDKYLLACREYDIPAALRWSRDKPTYHHVAAEYGMLELFKWFAANGHHIDWINLSYVAVDHNQIGLVAWMLKQGLGASPWRLSCEAALMGNLIMFRWFIERWGVHLTSTPIVWAVNAGHLHLVKWVYSVIHKHRYFKHADVRNFVEHAVKIKKEHPGWFQVRQEALKFLEEYYFTDRFVLN